MPEGPAVWVCPAGAAIWRPRVAVLGLILLGLWIGGPVLAQSPGTTAPRAAEILTGVTHGPAGKILSGVEIRVFLPGSGGKEAFLTTKSDDRGRFSLALTAPGFYQYVAVKGGYAVLVGQFNTLIQKTLDLVLRPAGPPGPPGSRPQDERWTLRLPARDLLEERFFEALPAGEVPLSKERLPLVLELSAGQLDEGNQETDGFRAFAAGRFSSADWGKFTLAFHHRGEGDSGEFREQGQEFSARWWSPGEVSRSYFDFSASRADRSRTTEGTYSGDFKSRVVALRGAFSHWIPGPRWSGVLRFEGTSLDTYQKTGDAIQNLSVEDFSAPAFSGSLVLEREREDSEFILETRAWTVEKASPDHGATVLSPLAAAEGLSGLGAMGSSGAAVGAVYRGEAGEGLALLARGRAEHIDGPWGGTRGTATAGVQWRWTETVLLSTEAGIAGGSEGDGEGIYSLTLQNDGREWHWYLRKARESGPIAWESLGGTTPTGFLMMTDREAAIENWEAQVRWEPEGNLPRIGLRGERYKVAGVLASNLPGDLILVPVLLNSRGRGESLALDIGLPVIGTWFQAAWDRLEDDAGAPLLPGQGGSWNRGQLLFRQRVLSRERIGANCDLVLGFERAKLQDRQPKDPNDTLRIALLDRKRFSGGVALTF